MTPLVCILAAPDLDLEPELVARSAAFGVHVVRRSLDAADLLAAASLEPQLAIVLTATLPRLSRDLVSRICVDRLVIGLATDERSSEQLQTWGVNEVVGVRTVDQTLTDLNAALSGAPRVRGQAAQRGVWSTGVWSSQPLEQTEIHAVAPDVHLPAPVKSRGGVISVWGAPGSPGRTTSTLMLGQLFASRGHSVCLVDADTTAPSLLQILDLPENASSLVVACRFAERDSLTVARLTQTLRTVDDRLFALGGVSNPEQWGDVRAAALIEVVEACRAHADFTIIDVGAGLERDRSTDLLSTRRFEAASAAIAESDALLAIAQATPLGISRLLQHLPSASNPSRPPTAIAVAPAPSKGSAREAVRSLRDYGIQLPIFELPRYATHEIADIRLRPLAGRRSFGRGSGLSALVEWLSSTAITAAATHGEGSTTMGVPT